MNMCTVREIREAIQEDCRSQRDMESTEIDRVFQTLPFSQERDLFDKPPLPKRPYRRRQRRENTGGLPARQAPLVPANFPD